MGVVYGQLERDDFTGRWLGFNRVALAGRGRL